MRSSRRRTDARSRAGRRPADRRRGFTLIEILVTLSMIAILGGAASWHYARQVERARDAAVMLELSHLRAAVAEYRALKGVPPPSLEATAGRTLRRAPRTFRAGRARGEYTYDAASGDVRLLVLEGGPGDTGGRPYAGY